MMHVYAQWVYKRLRSLATEHSWHITVAMEKVLLNSCTIVHGLQGSSVNLDIYEWASNPFSCYYTDDPSVLESISLEVQMFENAVVIMRRWAIHHSHPSLKQNKASNY